MKAIVVGIGACAVAAYERHASPCRVVTELRDFVVPVRKRCQPVVGIVADAAS